ncbi:MAG: hypothetical protein EPO11_00920 [Gammaproteobacteria bacterium]|nr:MAG: hypothetical protein EPO11_00920 [Gammaproteobacteria bacterium]
MGNLIEILVSLLILSLMLLGFDAMQVTALQKAKAAYYFSVATQQLDVMTERLRALGDGNNNDALQAWNQQNQQVLPQGWGTIQDNVVSIFWGQMTEQQCSKNTVGQSGCLSIKI